MHPAVSMKRCVAGAVLALAAWLMAASTAHALSETFDVPGARLDSALWTTETGPSSFLGRTQLADWISQGGTGRFVVADGSAQLALSTFNPTGFSLYGTHAKSLQAFQPASATAYELSVRMQLGSLHPGIVYGIYFFGCRSGGCATSHDELDIEIVTNFLQPGAQPLRVQLNRYADEPLGAGHGPVVDLPPGFDPLAMHEWTIRWTRGRVTWFVDGTELFSATDFVPRGPMQANIIAWAPGPEWADAFHASLQPVASAALDRQFTAYVDSVAVVAVPEPFAWMTMLAALGLLAGARRMSRNPALLPPAR